MPRLPRFRGSLAAVGLALALLPALFPGPALAAFPGRDGMLATDDSDGACTGSCADGGGPGNRVWTVNARTGAATPITSSDIDAQAFEPRWSPSGQQLVFTQFAFPSANFAIALSDPTGAGVRTISLPTLDYAYDPSFTADGAHLLFAAQSSVARKFRYDIYRVGLDGAGLRRVTHLAAMIGPTTPIESSRGQLAFAWGGWIYLVERSGRRKRLVKGFAPDFSPNGKRMVFEDPRLKALWTIGLNGRGLHRLLRLAPVDTCSGGFQRAPSARPAYSPSGKFIVFTQYGRCGSPPDKLVVVHTDGTKPRVVLRGDPAQDAAWQPLTSTP